MSASPGGFGGRFGGSARGGRLLVEGACRVPRHHVSGRRDLRVGMALIDVIDPVGKRPLPIGGGQPDPLTEETLRSTGLRRRVEQPDQPGEGAEDREAERCGGDARGDERRGPEDRNECDVAHEGADVLTGWVGCQARATPLDREDPRLGRLLLGPERRGPNAGFLPDLKVSPDQMRGTGRALMLPALRLPPLGLGLAWWGRRALGLRR
jgi:hypothetical protein